jgi:hypothetical protein
MSTGWRGESKRHSIAKKYGRVSSKKTALSKLSSTQRCPSEFRVLEQTEVPSLTRSQYEMEFDDYENAKNFFKSLDSGSIYSYHNKYRVVYDRDERLKSIAKSRIVSSENEFAPGTKTYHLVQQNGRIVFDKTGLPVIFRSRRDAVAAKKIAREMI